MTNINDYANTLDEVAKKELERLWAMREKLAGVNEATLPILVQYCTIYAQINKLTQIMSTQTDEKEWDKSLARLDKLIKMLLSFMKVLKLGESGAGESNNKFAKLLLNK